MQDKEVVALLKVVGKQMREARELCDFTIDYAAKLLSVDKLFLSKFEQCVDVDFENKTLLQLIYEASKIYDVSIDFLFGLSDDWERCEEVKWQRQVGRWVFDIHQSNFNELANQVRVQQVRQNALSDAVRALITALEGIEEAVKKFSELNPSFDDMRAGEMLVNRIKIANSVANETRLGLVRCKIIPRQESCGEAK